MSILITVKSVSKTVGSKKLFEDLNFGIHEQEKIGLMGPNGSGKSTLLKMLYGLETPDQGEINRRKGLRMAYVAQEPSLPLTGTVLEAVVPTLQGASSETEMIAASCLSQVGFEDLDTPIQGLSGGWRKRLALAQAMAQEPELLILDEPTNHMDWKGILWLESWLKIQSFSLILVSHDRHFLNAVTNRTIEINALYEQGYLSFSCPYNEFLKRKEDYRENQLRLQASLGNKARRELEWLRSSPQARTTKSQARIREAHQLLGELQNVKNRNLSQYSKSRLEVDASGRKTKKLIETQKLTLQWTEQPLIENLDLVLTPQTCLGLLGHNGSGKSTLLKALTGEVRPRSGTIQRAEHLKIIYFDQKREQLPLDQTLVQYLGDGSDTVIFKGEAKHVASYAARFLFASDKMNLKIAQLSGGEQARLLIAKQFLQPADVLILDEPTNDLDIETIELLEQTLLDFSGLVIVVSHDRLFMENTCDQFLALYGDGRWVMVAEIDQWLREKSKETKSSTIPDSIPTSQQKTKKLSYKEKQQLLTIEADILRSEETLAELETHLQNPEWTQDYKKMAETSSQIEALQQEINQMYDLWSQLEQKK